MSAIANKLASYSQHGNEFKVYDKNRRAVNIAEECRGKIVGFYFSASWCPPCRSFTPILSNFYKKYHKSKKFEVIFVSSDKEPQQALEYYMHMPFWRLSFRDVACKDKLKDYYGVQSIPRLVLVNADTGEVLNSNACSRLMTDDREGFQFPWRQKSTANHHQHHHGQQQQQRQRNSNECFLAEMEMMNASNQLHRQMNGGRQPM